MLGCASNVDWYRFWLLGGDRTDTFPPGECAATLRRQYKRWRQIEELRRLDVAQAHCPIPVGTLNAMRSRKEAAEVRRSAASQVRGRGLQNVHKRAQVPERTIALCVD